MILNIIMAVCMIPCFLIVYAILRSSGHFDNGMMFGVTMKEEWTHDESVEKWEAEFKKNLNWIFLLFLVSPIPMFFTKSLTVQITFWMLFCLLSISVPFIPFVKANDRLKKWKAEKGYYGELTRMIVTDLKVIEKRNRFVDTVMIALPIVSFAEGIALLIMKKDEVYLICAFTVFFCMVCFAAAYFFMDRMKATLISDNSDVNANYARANKKMWRNCWLQIQSLGFVCTIAFAVLAFLHESKAVTMLFWMVLGYTILSLIPIGIVLKKKKALNETYKPFTSLADISEDDRYWIGGIFYYNPSDHRTSIEKRVGIGTTMNMAGTAGKVCTVIGVIAILLMFPGISILVGMEEYTPISINVSDGEFHAEHLLTDYDVSVSDMEEIQMISELPKLSKVVGTGSDTLYKGTFQVRERGKCEIMLNPENHKFITFTANGTLYYFGCENDQETQDVYDLLVQSK